MTWRETRLVAALVISAGVPIGCGKAPTSPEQNGSGLLVTVPLSPANGTVVADFSTATWVAANATAPAGGVVFITFEFDTDPQFVAPARQTVVRQGEGGQTTLEAESSFGSALVGRTAYWRVRAGTGETLGQWSRAATFVIGPPVDPDRLFAEPPTLLSPINVVMQQRGVSLIAREGAHSGGPVAVKFQWATNPGFSNFTPCFGSPYPEPREHACYMGLLAPGTYYWRAQTSATRPGSSHAEGVSSAFSPTAMFTVAPVEIRSPISANPNLQYSRPTIVFQNATRSGDVGPLLYRFEIMTGGSFSNNHVVTSPLVPEGSGSTSWTVPIDLMVDTTYFARVRAIDSRSGFEGEQGRSNDFLVLGRQYSMAVMNITSSCRSTADWAAFIGRFGDSPFTVRTSGSLILNLQAAGLFGGFAGTLWGGSKNVSITGPNGNSPASTTGDIQADGSIAGTFIGVATYGSPFLFSCAPGPISWSVR